MDHKHCVLITGITKRLGLALAHHFLDKGWQVVGTYRSESESLNSLWDKGATLYQCDFQDMDAVNDLNAEIKLKHIRLRAVIHNASDWMPEGKGFPNEQVFDRMFNVHTKVPYLFNLNLRDNLRNSINAEHLADIIHITDFVAEKGSKKHIAYAASKAALENLTLSFAAAFAPEIKVNSIAPALLKFNEGDDDEYKQKAVKKASLPWEGGFEEAIATVEYLLESKYVTGRILNLDGGRHIK
ncbi:dihydromonapterin reductase [Oleiphilus sp. HI0125]|uniref:dihydromonapterin reductase n=1 Tax=Oleiphilus sp. HI0125 TaxID=1822266 RepID=UPI0007C370D7|nr:dihydromonapterin reductase [Oleiphilus sp. HI0125]KZZ59982.1 dihydromonapterin reductase [Oleiphilus sp. HI0125]